MLTETLLLIFVLGVLALVFLPQEMRQVENFGSPVLSCDCYTEHTNLADSMCWKKNINGQYVNPPVMPCEIHADPKCGCWEKHTLRRGGFCYTPGDRYGVRPLCTVK